MKFSTTIAFGITLACTLAASGGGAKNELDKLKGTWKPASYEIGGNKLEGEVLKTVVAAIIIQGDAFEWKAGDGSSKGTVKIDVSKDPKHIDFVIEPTDGVKITAWSGIYAVSGDTLKFCIGPGMAQRPKDFSTKSLTHAVLTLKQAK